MILPTRGQAARSASEDPSPDRRLRRLVLSVVLLGLVLLTCAAAVAVTKSQPVPVAYLGLVVLATLFADATLINLRIGHHVESYTWGEANVLLGLALLAPSHQVLTSVCVAAACVATRRSLQKVLYNTAAYAVGVALAAAVTRAITEPSWDRPVLSALALTAGAAAFSCWNIASIKAAIAFSQGLPFWTVYRRNAGMVVLVAVGNVVLALAALALAHYSLEVLVALPVLVGVAYLGYRGLLRAQQEREVWNHMEATSREMVALDEGDIAEVAIPRAATLLEADEVELCLYDPNGGLDITHVGDTAGRRLVRSEQRQPGDRSAVTTYRPLTGGEAEETCALVPLMGRQSQIGVLRVRFRARVDLTRRERQLLDAYCNTLSANLDNARLYAAVRAQAALQEQAARHDPLTGLTNRLALSERITEALATPSASFALLLLDLDRFKQVNDRYGHAAGDDLLRTVAERMRRAVRPTDTVARLGGDEFAVLLSDPDAAAASAARLRSVIIEPVDLGSTTVTVGASIGAARWPGDATDVTELFERADREMYADKERRRQPATGASRVVELPGSRPPLPADSGKPVVLSLP